MVFMNSSTVVAHIVKLVVTTLCMRHLVEWRQAFGRTKTLPTEWSLRAFEILFMHSLLGIFRFVVLETCLYLLLAVCQLFKPLSLYSKHKLIGIPFTLSSRFTARCFRYFYDWFSVVVEIVPLALLTSGILSAYQIEENLRMLLLMFGTIPIFFPLVKNRNGSQHEGRKLHFFTNIIIVAQILVITILGLQNDNYNVISLVASYTFKRFFVEEFCYQYSIPYTDLMQYCICFVEVFTVLTVKEL